MIRKQDARAPLQRQCLDRRLANRLTLEADVAAWTAARNGAGVAVD